MVTVFGHSKGLLRFVQTATGEANFEIKESVDSDGPSKLFLVGIAPASIRPHRQLIRRIPAKQASWC